MIVTLPRTASHLDAASLTGWTRPVPGGDPELRGAVVLKGTFTLHGQPGTTLSPTAAAAGQPIAYADTGDLVKDADTGVVTGFDLRYEADVALEKARADVVVAGWPSTAGGCVTVGGQAWLSRAEDEDVETDRDTARNLFGWLPRSDRARAVEAPQQDPLPDAYTPAFNNFSRTDLGPVSTTPPEPQPGHELPPGTEVRISRQRCGVDDATALTFTLPVTTYTARLRAYCGHGPDRAPRWRIVDELPLTPDTLIVSPADGTVMILWRASWAHGAVPEEHWRAVEIREGGA